jgi:hypothetical protein
MLRKYLSSIKIVQFAPQVIIDISYVKWRDNEHFCRKTQIKYISFRTCVRVSIICPLGKINILSNRLKLSKLDDNLAWWAVVFTNFKVQCWFFFDMENVHAVIT